MSLVFSFLLFSCSENKKDDRTVTIQWKGRLAESIIIPRHLLSGVPNDSIENLLEIHLIGNRARILGEYMITTDSVVFHPLIPFTRGLKYEVRLGNKLISEIVIPPVAIADAPKIIAIYPTADTLPVNLLKIYIEFSKPMQEGKALENLVMIKNGHDTMSSVFLDLQQELWNKERTMLTLWLDPGRIKRDLQPNKKLGAPLQGGSSYQLLIKNDWTDAEALSLSGTYQKNFSVGIRDSLSPDPDGWTIRLPKAGSSEPLKIELHEPLDYILLKNAIRIVDKSGNVVSGAIETGGEETILSFTPSAAWSTGDYEVEIESRLEDLAGNNLNRLFDRDVTKESKKEQKEIYKRSFHIK